MTDIRRGACRVGAPPAPILADPYQLRRVDPDTDAEMMSEWTNRPHLVEAWEYDMSNRRMALYALRRESR